MAVWHRTHLGLPSAFQRVHLSMSVRRGLDYIQARGGSRCVSALGTRAAEPVAAGEPRASAFSTDRSAAASTCSLYLRAVRHRPLSGHSLASLAGGCARQVRSLEPCCGLSSTESSASARRSNSRGARPPYTRPRQPNQPDGRVRHWRFVPELNKCLRVVPLEDRETLHNAFPGRSHKPPAP